MQDGLYVALSSQVALEKRLVTIADNVANANTVGFRATQVKFEDVVTGTGERSVSFASAGDTYLSTNQGPLKQTGNPYDFAVRGDAWFAIDTPAGQVMTRDGRYNVAQVQIMAAGMDPITPVRMEEDPLPHGIASDGTALEPFVACGTE